MNVGDLERPTPYTMSQPPTSPGRALLARAYLHYCGLEWGYSGNDLAAAFAEDANRRTRDEVASSTRLFGELLARGDIRSWARAFGGGEPTLLKPTLWELDDYIARFATSAINLAYPFNPADPTHWIFVNLDDWNRVVEDLLGMDGRSTIPTSTGWEFDGGQQGDTEQTTGREDLLESTDRLIRLPEVIRRTSLSKPTIYRRMKMGRFPQQTLLDGNMSVWREDEIASWIAEPR
jgi:predicted DNA-binding transcriptional regulator AlpA